MASHFDQENQLPTTHAQSSRFGLRKENGQPKLGLSIVNSNAANTKKLHQVQGKKVNSKLSVLLNCVLILCVF